MSRGTADRTLQVAGAQSGAQSSKILLALQKSDLSMNEVVAALQLQSKTGSLMRCVSELLAADLMYLIEYTIPEKPNSRLQKYRLTKKGKGLIAGLAEEEG